MRSSIVAAVVLLGGGRVAGAQEATAAVVNPPPPVHFYAQAGVGLVEIGHLELGTFLTPHISVEGMVAWTSVFGTRYGGGGYYTFGHSQGGRPPRHGLMVGARLMLDSDASFDAHGDDLSSYLAIPIGYSFMSDGGFFFRAAIAGVVARERTSREGPDPLTPIIDHHWAAGGPLFTVAAGLAF